MDPRAKARRSSEAKGFLAFLRLVALVAAAVALYLLAWILLPPSPAALPDGAARLEMRTQASHIGARLVLGCAAAALPEMRVASDGLAMIFLRVAGAGGAEIETGPGGTIDPVWPAGWSARLLDGRAELVSPDGVVVAREGDLIRSLGGGNGVVCLTIGSLPRVDPPR